jgi:hypothetical protein
MEKFWHENCFTFYSFSTQHAALSNSAARQREAKKGVVMLIKIFVALGALWALGFFVYQSVRLMLGRRVF